MPLSPIYMNSVNSQVTNLNNMGGDGASSWKASGFFLAIY